MDFQCVQATKWKAIEIQLVFQIISINLMCFLQSYFDFCTFFIFTPRSISPLKTLILKNYLVLRSEHARSLLKIQSLIFWRCNPTRTTASSFFGFLNHTQRRTTVGRTLDEWSARRRDLYLTTDNNLKIHPSIPLVGSEPENSAVERLQTNA
jgi:hypothetical protein